MKKLFMRILIFIASLLSIFFGIIKPFDAIIIIEILFIILSAFGIFLTYTIEEFMLFPSSILKNIIATIFVLIFTVNTLDFVIETQSKILLNKTINSLYIYIASISIPILSIILGLIGGYNCKDNI